MDQSCPSGVQYAERRKELHRRGESFHPGTSPVLRFDRKRWGDYMLCMKNTGSIFFEKDNIELLTRYCAEHLDSNRIPGYMQTVWERVADGWMDMHYEAVDRLKASKDWLKNNR